MPHTNQLSATRHRLHGLSVWILLCGLLLPLAMPQALPSWAKSPQQTPQRPQNESDNPESRRERKAKRKLELAKQPLLETTIPLAKLKQDFQLFRQVLEQAHGGLYLHTTKTDFDSAFDRAYRSLTEPMKVREFSMLLAPLIDMAHCGHTSITISDKQLERFMKSGQLFPLPIIFLGGKSYVDHDKVDVPLGAEILSVNETPMAEILNKLLMLAPADGLSTTMKYRSLPIDFDLAYALAYGEPKQFKIAYRPFGSNRVQTKTIAAIPGKRTVALYDSRYSARKKSKKFGYQSIDEETGLLSVNTFEFGVRKKSKQKYKDFLQETFTALRGETGKKNLIIDLRKNEGGYPKNEMLLSAYLANKPFREMKNAKTITLQIPAKEHLDRKEFPPGIIRYVEKHLVADFEKTDSGIYQIRKEKNREFKPREAAYQGKIYVLISGTTHSGASSLCSLLREYSHVTFIGEETGGCSTAFTAGNLLVYNLPHSWCQLVIPVIRYETNLHGSKYPAHGGVVPDHAIQQTQKQFVEGTDPVLQFALQRVKESSKPSE